MSNGFDNRLNVCIHDTTGCQTGLTIGCIVYTNIYQLSNRFDNRFYRVNGALVLRLVGLVPHSSVSLLLDFSAMLSVSLVSRVTVRSLHDNMLGCQSPSGEWT